VPPAMRAKQRAGGGQVQQRVRGLLNRCPPMQALPSHAVCMHALDWHTSRPPHGCWYTIHVLRYAFDSTCNTQCVAKFLSRFT